MQGTLVSAVWAVAMAPPAITTNNMPGTEGGEHFEAAIFGQEPICKALWKIPQLTTEETKIGKDWLT